MNIDDISPYYMSLNDLLPDGGMTAIEWATFLVAVAAAVSGMLLLLQAADLL